MFQGKRCETVFQVFTHMALHMMRPRTHSHLPGLCEAICGIKYSLCFPPPERLSNVKVTDAEGMAVLSTANSPG